MDNEGLDQIDEENLFPLTDEFGNEVNFEFLDMIEYESEKYVVLLPVEDEGDDNGVVVILKVDDNDTDDEELYSAVEDQDTINAVFQIFKDKFKDEFTFQAPAEDAE